MIRLKQFILERKDIELLAKLEKVADDILDKFINQYESVIDDPELDLPRGGIRYNNKLSIEIGKKEGAVGGYIQNLGTTRGYVIMLADNFWYNLWREITDLTMEALIKEKSGISNSREIKEKNALLITLINLLKMYKKETHDYKTKENLIHELAHYFDMFEGKDSNIREILASNSITNIKRNTPINRDKAYYRSPHELHAYFMHTLYELKRLNVEFSDFNSFLKSFIGRIGIRHWNLLRDRQQKSYIKRLYQYYNEYFDKNK